jgi:hypothetical protein
MGDVAVDEERRPSLGVVLVRPQLEAPHQRLDDPLVVVDPLGPGLGDVVGPRPDLQVENPAADPVASLQQHHLAAGPPQDVRGVEPRHSGPNDHHVDALLAGARSRLGRRNGDRRRRGADRRTP